MLENKYFMKCYQYFYQQHFLLYFLLSIEKMNRIIQNCSKNLSKLAMFILILSFKTVLFLSPHWGMYMERLVGFVLCLIGRFTLGLQGMTSKHTIAKLHSQLSCFLNN